MRFFKTKPSSPLLRPAFTLVELLVYMALFSGFLLVMSTLFISALQTQSEATGSAHVDQDSWYLLSRMQYDFVQATDILTPATNGDTSSTLVLDQSGTQVTYSLSGDTLMITRGGVSAAVVGPQVSVTNLSFQRLGNVDGTSSIKIQMDLENTSSSKSLDFTLGLRK